MSNALVENIFNEPESAEETAVPATDRELLLLTERISQFEIPIKVFLQVVAIAAYDRASAFRYADNYLTTHKKNQRQKSRLLQPVHSLKNN